MSKSISRPQGFRPSRYIPALAASVILIILAWPASAQQRKGSQGVGIVYGKVLKVDGKPLGGVWLMIENLELGMIYRKDVNPSGQFEFADVYPGTYIFKLSPALYLVKSPAKITVKADEALEVEVRVERAAAE